PALPLVGDQDGSFCFSTSDGAEAPDANNLVLSGRWILSVCHHGKAAIVASKADAYEPFVFHPRAQAQGTEITQVDAAPGQSFVELHHERLVFWTNRAKRDRGSVLQAAFRDILDGIRTNRWPRQMVRLDGGIMNHNPRIQRQQALR